MVVNRKFLSIPGGRRMLILIPWKPVVDVWCLLAAMLWVGYVGYSVLERTPLRWHSTIRITFRHTALPITELPTKVIQTHDEVSVSA